MKDQISMVNGQMPMRRFFDLVIYNRDILSKTKLYKIQQILLNIKSIAAILIVIYDFNGCTILKAIDTLNIL